jgi:hypothetical protein
MLKRRPWVFLGHSSACFWMVLLLVALYWFVLAESGRGLLFLLQLDLKFFDLLSDIQWRFGGLSLS